MNPVPKPQKRPPKPRQPLRRKRSRVRRRVAGPRPSDALAHPKPRRAQKTAHGRRPRETGFMAFCHDRGCEMKRDADLQKLIEVPHRRCSGRQEFAHLSDRRRYDVGDVGSCLCKEIHDWIDRRGNKQPRFATFGRHGEHMIRMRLANRARAAWDALTAEARARWDEIAASRRATRYA